jgi:hypothetical protein
MEKYGAPSHTAFEFRKRCKTRRLPHLYNTSANPLKQMHLDSRVLLRELPRQRLDTVHNPLELILLLARDLTTSSRWVIFLITPLDLESRKVELRIQAVNVLVVIRRKPTQGGDERHKFTYVIPVFELEKRWLFDWLAGLTGAHRPSSPTTLRCRCSSSCARWRGGSGRQSLRFDASEHLSPRFSFRVSLQALCLRRDLPVKGFERTTWKPSPAGWGATIRGIL